MTQINKLTLENNGYWNVKWDYWAKMISDGEYHVIDLEENCGYYVNLSDTDEALYQELQYGDFFSGREPETVTQEDIECPVYNRTQHKETVQRVIREAYTRALAQGGWPQTTLDTMRDLIAQHDGVDPQEIEGAYTNLAQQLEE
jgi:hypothetical protein